MEEPKFVWKAEIKFAGTVAEFNNMSAKLEQLPLEVNIPEWQDRPGHTAGCFPVPIDFLININILNEIAADMPRIKVKFVDDIKGGMRTPHLHLQDEVVLLDRARFRTFVGKVAQAIGQRRAESNEDYIRVMDPINRLFPTTQAGAQLPLASVAADVEKGKVKK